MPPISILDCFSLACFSRGSQRFRGDFFADRPQHILQSKAVRVALWRENQILKREKALQQERLDLERARRQLLKQQELLDLQRRKRSSSRRRRAKKLETLQLYNASPRRSSQLVYVL
jgi:hypothetical protein